MKDGKGKLIFKNGDIFEGEYKWDRIDGKGVYITHEGIKTISEYKNGEKIGKCESTRANQNKIK